MKRATAILALFASVLSGCNPPVADNPDTLKGAPTPQRASSAAALRPVALVRAPQPQPVWVALEDAGKVVKVDVASRRVLRRFEVPGAPHNLTVSGNGEVIATLQTTGRIVVVRRGRVRSVSLGASPHDVKIMRGVAVVTNEGAARLDRVSVRSGRVRRAIPLKTNPHDLAISPGGNRAWVTLDGTDDIAIVNLLRKRVRRYLSTGKSPHDVLFAPGGRRVWVTDWRGSVHVFSRKGELLTSINRGVELHHLVFTRDGRQAWVTDGGGDQVLIISTRSLRVVAAKSIKGSPHHVALTPSGRRVVVADHDRGTLVVFDVATRRRLRTIQVGQAPHGVWIGR
ncbi:MAG: YncE family protein [Actinobacteria bacterium]|nr:YncE family protein [Actinomycetota bacterium]